MTDAKAKSTRRSFFLRGGAILGAGVATTTGATAVLSDSTSASQQLESVQDREAIRQLHLAFTSSMEDQAYELTTELFDDQAHLSLSGLSVTGMPAIAHLFATQYRRQQAPVLHTAFRQNASQRQDLVTLSHDCQHATATFHTEAQLSIPLRADSTVAQMARLQGQMADCRWEAGRFEAQYVKVRGQWKMASLRYLQT